MIIEKTAYHDISPGLKKTIASEKLTDTWNSLTDIQRNEWVCWTTIATQEATRATRLQRAIEELQEGKKTPCCWPGCPHRNPKNEKWLH